MVMRIKDIFQEFLNYSLLERGLEITTINWYKWSMRPFYNYLRYKLLKADIEVMTVENLRDFFVSQRLKGNSSKTICNIMGGIKSFCTFLVKREYLANNP